MKRTKTITILLGSIILAIAVLINLDHLNPGAKAVLAIQVSDQPPEDEGLLPSSTPDLNQVEQPIRQVSAKTLDNVSTGKPIIIYENATLTVQTNNYPLPLLLEHINQATNIVFHADHTIQSHLITADIDAVPIDQALKSLLIHYRYAFYYKDNALFSIGVYPSKSDSGRYVDILDNNEPDYDAMTTNQAIDSAENLQHALISAKTSEETADLISTGLQSSNENIRALSLLSAGQKNLLMQSNELEQLSTNDSSDIVRAIALSQLLNHEQITNEFKNEFALFMSSDPNDDISRQANDYLNTLNQDDYESGQQNSP